MKRIIVLLSVVIALAGAVVLLWHNADGPAADGPAAKRARAKHDGPLRVITTTGMIADAAERVGGELVQVIALMGPGVDPHLYRASEGDVTRLSQADAIFYNGLHLEGKLGDVLGEMKRRGIHTAAVAEQVPHDRLRQAKGFAGSHDPHVWFDVALWAEVVKALRDNLVELLPGARAAIAANAQRYLERLHVLDREVRERVATIPPGKRVLVTAHDAFGYFARAYGLEVHGIQGVSTASEAGAADLQRLAQLIAERQLPAIFVESSVPPRVVQALEAAVKARGFAVRIGGELYSDALGPRGSGAEHYEGMVRHNVETIVGALAGGPATVRVSRGNASGS